MSSKRAKRATKRRAGTPKGRTAKARAKAAKPARRRVAVRREGTARKPHKAARREIARPEAAQRKVARPKPVRVSPRMLKLREMLERKRAELIEQIRRAREESLDVDRNSFAEVGDLVSASVEKEKAFEHGEAGVHALREIAGALQKLKEGTYGVCEKCGKQIGVKRLEAMPHARLCVNCKIKEETSGKVAPEPAENVFED